MTSKYIATCTAINTSMVYLYIYIHKHINWFMSTVNINNWIEFFLFSEINCWNPAFDVTPAELITGGIITEFGVFEPSEMEVKLRKALAEKNM